MEFMTLRYNLVKTDLSAWRYRLGRKGLNYISMCLKTKTPIAWTKIFVLLYEVKNLSLPFKMFWRFLRYFFLNNNLKSK